MSKKKANITLGNIADSDVAWVTLMNNKEFYATIGKYIAQERNALTGTEQLVTYGGACIIGFGTDNLEVLIDEYTIDLVIYGKRGKFYQQAEDDTKQGVYKTVRDWAKTTSTNANSRFILYFLGDAHGSGKGDDYPEIHWNCVIVDTVDRVLIVYDPSDEELEIHGNDLIYNFNPKKRAMALKELCETLGIFLNIPDDKRNRRKSTPMREQKIRENQVEYKMQFVFTQERVQQICEFGHPSLDFFCQTWVLIFASAYVNDLFDMYKYIPFEKLQNLPLKMWVNCILSRGMKANEKEPVDSKIPVASPNPVASLREWRETLDKKEYALFRSYCRTEINGESKCFLLPPVQKQVCEDRPCIFSIVTNFLGLQECVKPGQKIDGNSKDNLSFLKKQYGM